MKCVLAIDSDHDGPAIETREENLGHKGLLIDIVDYETNHVSDSHKADLLWTSPPCQSFSSSARDASKKRAADRQQDIRDNLFLASVFYVERFRPRFVVLENVMGLLSHVSNGKRGETFAEMRRSFSSLGYHVEFNVLNALNFGLPQMRERVFIVASRDGEKGLIPPEPVPKVMPRFGDIKIENLQRGVWSPATYKTAFSKVREGRGNMTLVADDDVLPTVTCAWGGGATRKRVGIIDRHPCSMFDGCGAEHFSYIRHPDIIEGARAQGFPMEWTYPELESLAWNLIGNAVPPPMARAIALHLRKVARGETPPYKSHLSASKLASYTLEQYSGKHGEDIPGSMGF